MSRLYSNQLVPIPPGSEVYSDHKVFEPPKAPRREMLIGYAVSETMMHPYLNYFSLYGQGHPDMLKVGFYALVLGIAKLFGIYDRLIQAFGLNDANRIMDHVMSLIREKNNTTTAIEGEITFTGMPLPDHKSSECFSIAHEKETVQAALDQWLQEYTISDLKSVYLVMTGFHGDRAAADSQPTEPTGPASWRGLIWAVQANGYSGFPIPYFQPVYGSLTVGSIREIENHFQNLGVSIQGILCDQDFSDRETLLTLQKTGLPYMVQLHKDTVGFQTMSEKWATRVRTPSDYLGDGVYGFTGNVQVFPDMDFSAPIAAFYSPKARGEEELTLVSAISAVIKELKHSIRRGTPASVPKEMERYLRIDVKRKKRTVCVDETAYQAELQTLGVTCIATSDEKTALEAKTIYGYRKVADKATAYFKRLMGDSVFPAHPDSCTTMKLFTCFVASRIWYHIQFSCNDMGRDVDGMIEDLGDFQYQLVQREYQFVLPSLKYDQVALLGKFDVSLGMLRDFAVEVSRRYIEQPDPAQRGDIDNTLLWVRPGRYIRTGNRVTDSSPAVAAKKARRTGSPSAQGKPKHPGGRPKGSKNRATLARDAQEVARGKHLVSSEPEQRKRGRPAGSKDPSKHN